MASRKNTHMLYIVPPNTNPQKCVKPQDGFRQRSTVFGAGEHGRRLRGVFGIPHTAAKINKSTVLG